MKRGIIAFLSFVLLSACTQVEEPQPCGPVPNEAQLLWHDLEYYAFVHFSMNTFTDMEWGTGGEDPATFNPSELDCNQWVRTMKAAGMKAVIFTAKHHDGFCLWPTATTAHSIKNSPYKNGEGDIVKELSEACEKEGLKLGIYLSPWDRNSALYGSPEYIDMYRAQLRELLTNYGEIFEIWWDGANGGDGYYGGANEVRKIDRRTYYDWENTIKIVRELQPNACIFSDGGPEVRWVGNEQGWAGETNWSIIRHEECYAGMPNGEQLSYGHEDGSKWVPAECDVSIRPGWFYHSSQDTMVKTVEELKELYYKSVGRNGSFLLNIPVSDKGLIHETDSTNLLGLRKVLDQEFATNLAKDVKLEASNTRGGSKLFAVEQIVDGDLSTYWASDDDELKASIVIDFGAEISFDRFLVQEYIPLGQRVKSFTVEALIDGEWKEIDSQTTIGAKRILRLPLTKTNKVRFNITDAKACPCISNIEIY